MFIQSFESANLQYLRSKTPLPLVQLMDEGALIYDSSGTRVVSVNIPDYGDHRGGQRPSQSRRHREVCERDRTLEASDPARYRQASAIDDDSDRAGTCGGPARAHIYIS